MYLSAFISYPVHRQPVKILPGPWEPPPCCPLPCPQPLHHDPQARPGLCLRYIIHLHILELLSFDALLSSEKISRDIRFPTTFRFLKRDFSLFSRISGIWFKNLNDYADLNAPERQWAGSNVFFSLKYVWNHICVHLIHSSNQPLQADHLLFMLPICFTQVQYYQVQAANPELHWGYLYPCEVRLSHDSLFKLCTVFRNQEGSIPVFHIGSTSVKMSSFKSISHQTRMNVSSGFYLSIGAETKTYWNFLSFPEMALVSRGPTTKIIPVLLGRLLSISLSSFFNLTSLSI